MSAEQFNYRLQKIYRLIRKRLLETRVLRERSAFFCAALSGESIYNICINSDMTVSCNCQDYDGSGHIGDLNHETLDQVFASSTAQRFRTALASGTLPILTCASCPELRTATIGEACYHRNHWQVCKKGIMVENTVACPYRCTACYRSLVLSARRATHMSLDDMRKIASTIRTHGIEHVSFFNLGETFAAPQVCEQLRILRESNPSVFILISTNGMLLDNDEKREAALLADRIVFSIDGIDDCTMNKYQHGASFSRAYGNLRQLVQYRRQAGKTVPVIEWKYVLFNWNDRPHMLLKAIELAKAAGVDSITFCPSTSPVYGVSWRYFLHPFHKDLGELTWKGREVHFAPPDSVGKSTAKWLT